jgi:hypothetical protein
MPADGAAIAAITKQADQPKQVYKGRIGFTLFQHSARVGHFQGEELELQQKAVAAVLQQKAAAAVLQQMVATAVMMKQWVLTRLRQVEV